MPIKKSPSKITASRKKGSLKFLSTGKSKVDYEELWLYVENGTTNFKDDKGRVVKPLTSVQVQVKYPQFQKYKTSTFNSALYCMKKQVVNMANERQSYGSTNNGIKQNNISTLHKIFED